MASDREALKQENREACWQMQAGEKDVSCGFCLNCRSAAALAATPSAQDEQAQEIERLRGLIQRVVTASVAAIAAEPEDVRGRLYERCRNADSACWCGAHISGYTMAGLPLAAPPSAQDGWQPHYSGEASRPFWEYVHKTDDETVHKAAYDLQNAEQRVLKALERAVPFPLPQQERHAGARATRTATATAHSIQTVALRQAPRASDPSLLQRGRHEH